MNKGFIRGMETKHIVVFFGILIAAVVFWFTLPDAIELHTEHPAAVEPWLTPEVQHLGAHGIHIGPSKDSDIRVMREGDSLKVEIDAVFLQKQEAGFLTTVGMLKPVETMSEERFAEFVEVLHLTVLTEDEKAGHIDEHQEREADPHTEQKRHGGGLIDIIGK
jgi:hypothetical protein